MKSGVVQSSPRSAHAQWEVVTAGNSSTIGKIRKIIPLGASFELSAITAARAAATTGIVGAIIPNVLEVEIDSFTLAAGSVGPVIAVGP